MKTDSHMPRLPWPAGHAGNGQYYPFGMLLGLSLLVHLLVLAQWSFLNNKHIELTLPVADFAVQLTPARNNSQSKTVIPASLPKAVTQSKARSSQTQPIKANKQNQIVHQQTATATQADVHDVKEHINPRAAPASSNKNHHAREKSTADNSHHHVISRLQHKLKQYFYYPRLARRKNIQGTVVIGFAINLRGTLTNIRVIKSSGFAILDMAAEDALLKLHHLDGNQNWQANNRDLELPVIYKLTEG